MNERKYWPSYRYHKVHEPRIFQNQQELDGAGEGWRDTPFSQEEREVAASNLLFAELEDTGEEDVRIKLARGNYVPDKIQLVEEWLNKKDKERGQAIKEIELSFAQKSANAAEKSAKLTWWNVFLTGIAVIVSILSLYFSLQKR